MEPVTVNQEASGASRTAARAQSGMTLIEIMIVLAIIALIMGLLVGPAVLKQFGKAKRDTAYQMTKQIEGAYAKWSVDNTDNECPESIDDLKQALGKRKSDEIKDPWGTPYVILCGDQAPEACEGFCALSVGPDKKQDTGDDIKSWEKPKKK